MGFRTFNYWDLDISIKCRSQMTHLSKTQNKSTNNPDIFHKPAKNVTKAWTHFNLEFTLKSK